MRGPARTRRGSPTRRGPRARPSPCRAPPARPSSGRSRPPRTGGGSFSISSASPLASRTLELLALRVAHAERRRSAIPKSNRSSWSSWNAVHSSSKLSFSARVERADEAARRCVPTTRSTGMRSCSRTRMTPMWAKPRAAPPPRTSAMRGSGTGVSRTSGGWRSVTSGGGEAVRQAARSRSGGGAERRMQGEHSGCDRNLTLWADIAPSRTNAPVIESMELAQVIAEAADIATSVNQKLTSAHQLLAFFTVPNRAEILLKERGIDEDRILATMTGKPQGGRGRAARPARAVARGGGVGRSGGGRLPAPPHRDEARPRERRAPAPRRLRAPAPDLAERRALVLHRPHASAAPGAAAGAGAAGAADRPARREPVARGRAAAEPRELEADLERAVGDAATPTDLDESRGRSSERSEAATTAERSRGTPDLYPEGQRICRGRSSRA